MDLLFDLWLVVGRAEALALSLLDPCQVAELGVRLGVDGRRGERRPLGEVQALFEIPLDIAFDYRVKYDSKGISDGVNIFIDLLNIVDVVFNFRTTFINKESGQEIIDTKEI